MTGAFAFLILCPLFAAVLSFALGRRAAPLLWALTLGLTGYALTEATWRLWQAGPLHHSLGGWGAPLGIELRMDGPGYVGTFATSAFLVCNEVLTLDTTADFEFRLRKEYRLFNSAIGVALIDPLNGEYLAIDLGRLVAGDYRLTIEVTDHRGEGRATRTTTVTLVD